MIRKRIEEGAIEEAQVNLEDFFKFIEQERGELGLQITRMNRINKEDLQGVMSSEDKSLETNKIALATLLCCNNIEKKVKEYFPTVTYEVTSKSIDEQLKLKLMDKYEKVREVSKSDSAIFYEYKEAITGRRVMIRILKSKNFGETSLHQLNNDRLQCALKIKHRNIIKILGSELHGFPRYLILEYVEGVSLDHLIGNIPFTVNRSISLIQQLCEALYHLHINGIIHKNIKPDKVLVDHELRPVISPFDIVSSKEMEQSEVISSENLLYASPEIIKGEVQSPDYKSDQFSMGLIAYEILAGSPLFLDRDQQSSRHNMQGIFERRLKFFNNRKFRKGLFSQLDAPQKVRSIIMKMLSEHPADRFDSFEEITTQLNQIRIPKNKRTEIALASYERCCIANPRFTNDFYDKLFKKFPAIEAHFTARNTEKKSRRAKMLRIAIETLIHCDEEPKKLKNVLGLNVHHGVGDDLYHDFIHTITDSIRENDYLWSDYANGSVRNPIESAWEDIKRESLQVIAQINKLHKSGRP